MNKINVQLGTLIIFISIVGCETTGKPSSSSSTVDQSLSTIEDVVQSSTAAVTSPTGISQIGLVDILVHRLGVSPQQALGGAGAIFQVAQSNMDPQAFATLSKSIPGMSTMLGAAPAMSGLGGLSSIAGGSSSTVANVSGLAASFQQLNLSPDMVGRFIPVVTNYVRQTSDQATADLLQSALTAR
ncbi:DUF2780 domain-containing protein [Nitrosomonas sp. Nm166]|uniref:DUF2780 domain-containing protein n=1 Tax=Nitrosomonas sp. Nm166 TaxID=1881054 RepID=UPI0008F2A2D5|nr:DUF2780 domain-containing protein [Nitrosomonas sp. Nm166]SFE06814.1 Protein of unknown function VcgC/VcgE [Nitrosomonas sp. Nm166]